MYALVNTMEKTDRYLGKVLSYHKTIAAANKADDKIQKLVQRGSGRSSYLPTKIVSVAKGLQGKGRRLETGEYALLSDTEIAIMMAS